MLKREKKLRLKIAKLLSTILLLTSIGASNGFCQSDPTFLAKDEKAPYPGLLFSEPKAAKLRNDLLELDKTKLLLETEQHRTLRLGQVISLKDEEIELYQTQNERLLKANKQSDTLQYIWFGLGVLATGLAVYGAGALAR